MWTPKRIMLLSLGFALFLAAYVGYGRVLGRIDGLPPLPKEYYPPEVPTDWKQPPPPKGNSLEIKLQQAFSPGCKELQWPIKLDVRSRGLVLAALSFHIDGQTVQLAPLSVAIFGKANGNAFPEISTIKAARAELVFDGPVTNPLEMGKRKILRATLIDDVQICNNRRTPQRDDDITLTVPKGEVRYDESQHHIWTNEPVQLEDDQSKPEPMKAKGIGMDVYLVAEPPAGRSGAPVPAQKGRADGVSGVERVVLRSAVEMELYADSHFLAGGKSDSSPKRADGKPALTGDIIPAAPVLCGAACWAGAQPAAAQKSRVAIRTFGPFNYDMIKDMARFDIPARGTATASAFPEQVQVTRFGLEGKDDTLECEHLELQFGHKKQVNPTPARDDHDMDREIESAHATGAVVVLHSSSDNLDATGTDFFYEARTRHSILRGDPVDGMHAMKDGDEIFARELQLTDHKEQGIEVLALGPGRIQAFDKQSEKRILTATWKDRLISRKVDGRDNLLLIGDATFVDPQSDPPQTLRGDIVELWLEPNTPAGKKAAPEPRNVPEEQKRPRLRELRATGHVVCTSREMNVHDTERLIVHFEDAPAGANPVLPTAGTAPETAAPPSSVRVGGPLPLPGGAPFGPDKPDAPPRPIDLQARLVTARVMRTGTKNEITKLWTEGDVHVRQAGSTPQERGIDITGETLDLTRKPEGSVLVVTGDLAQLNMNQVLIMGPTVNIDQARNYAWVDGKGAMRMESNTNFQGELVAGNRPANTPAVPGQKPPANMPLWVYWNERMVFDGQFPDFYGDVQAEQGDPQQTDRPQSRLLCQHLQVSLDHRVSFKEGEKAGQQPKVMFLFCSQDVHVEEVTRENGQLVKYQRIDCPTLRVNNEESKMEAGGYGVVRILQPSSEDPVLMPQQATPPRTQSLKPAEDTLKLTRVRYAGRMWGDNKKRLVTFTSNVEVYNLPADRPDVEIDPLHLPPGCLYMRCDRLEVLGRPTGAKTGQEMMAIGRVSVQSVEFSAKADTVSFNEEKDQVIFEGGEGGEAVLYKHLGAGRPPDVVRGKKFIYFRKTGKIKGAEVDSIQGYK